METEKKSFTKVAQNIKKVLNAQCVFSHLTL